MSIQEGGKGIREACVQARATLLAHAAELLGAPVGELAVGRWHHHGEDGSSVDLECAAEAGEVPPAGAGVKPSGPAKIIGKSAARIDLPAKIAGSPPTSTT